MSTQFGRSTTYSVAPFAVSVAHFVLFGKIVNPDDTAQMNESAQLIDALGHWWVLETIHNHPQFNSVVALIEKQKLESDYDHTVSIQSFATILLGSLGGVFGIAKSHTDISDMKQSSWIDAANKVGEPKHPQFTVSPDSTNPDGFVFSYDDDGTCPGCGQKHGDLDELLGTLKEKFGVDAKITTIEARVDENGEITNLDDIPEDLREVLVAKVKTLHAEMKASTPTKH